MLKTMKYTTIWPLVVLLNSLYSSDAIKWKVDERCCQLYRKSKWPEECEIFARRLEIKDNVTNFIILGGDHEKDELEEIIISLPESGNVTAIEESKRRNLRRHLDMEANETRLMFFEEYYEQHELEEISISLLKEESIAATNKSNHGQLRGDIQRGTNEDSFSSLPDNHRDLKETRETFVMRLHWEQGACWQEEMIERRWCMQCRGNDCKAGGSLWIQECKNIPQQRFEWVSTGGKLGRLKTAKKNLCLTKNKEVKSNYYYKLQRCSSSNKQLFARSSLNNIFELYPHNDFNKCVNQHHYPKWKEEIRTTTCAIARKWHTNRWKMIWKRTEGTIEGDDNNNDNGGGINGDKDNGNTRLSLKRKECTDKRPCGLCEGDCDSNKQCRGNLKCYQRDNDGTSLVVPGCSGIPQKGRDYCYRP